MENFSLSSNPGAWFVDFIPQCEFFIFTYGEGTDGPPVKYMPLCMPGTGFLRKAEEWNQHMYKTSWNPYLWSKKNLVCNPSRYL